MLLVLTWRWRVALDAPKNSNFLIISWQKINTQKKRKLKIFTHYIFTSGPDGGTFAGALYEEKAKQMATIPDRSEGMVNVSA